MKSFPRELVDFFNDPKRPMSSFVKDLINFDIEGMMSYVSGGNEADDNCDQGEGCLLYTSPSPRDKRQSRMPSSA